MVTTFAPLSIFLGVAATVGLLSFLLWDAVATFTATLVQKSTSRLDRAGINIKPQELLVSTIAFAAIAWTVAIVLLRPPLLVDVLLLPAAFVVGFAVVYLWVRWTRVRRLEEFVSQLELALRLIASGLRVGLGLRQAVNQVTEEMTDPAKYEFARVIGQTNLGVSVLDAMDDLAKRMPSNETLMMARAIRVQSQTGGDLATILEHLSNTIRDRRRLVRKAAALTAEGRMSAVILEVIPIVLAVFIIFTEPPMGEALLTTAIGHGVILTLVVLEAIGFLWLRQMLRLDV